MKVFRNNCAYVQKNDLFYLLNLSKDIPNTVLEKFYDKEDILIDDDNRFEFVKFDRPDEIIFFMNEDWIINYDNFQNMDFEEIESVAHKYYINSERMSALFNSLSNEEQHSNNGKDMMIESTKLRHIFDDLRILSEYKRGVINMTVPGEELGEIIDITQLQTKKAAFR